MNPILMPDGRPLKTFMPASTDYVVQWATPDGGVHKRRVVGYFVDWVRYGEDDEEPEPEVRAAVMSNNGTVWDIGDYATTRPSLALIGVYGKGVDAQLTDSAQYAASMSAAASLKREPIR